MTQHLHLLEMLCRMRAIAIAIPEVYAQTNELAPRMPTHSSYTSAASSEGILIQMASWLVVLSWGKTRPGLTDCL